MKDERKEKKGKDSIFLVFTTKAAELIGNEWSFIVSLLIILGWLASGPFFDFSDTWQLIINTSTAVITFLIVFLIQNSQNRDAKAVQVKLDELLRCHKLAHNSVINLQKLSDDELKDLEKKYEELSKKEKDTKVEEDLNKT